jgi:hypothetical protein
MMKTSTKLKVAGVASVLGVVLAASGAYAATGSLTSRDAPGQVLQVSGVGPASGHASATAVAHANPKAKAHANARATVHLSSAAAMPMAAGHSSVGQVARQAPQPLPAYHAVMQHVTDPVQPAAPQPVTRPGIGMPSSPMR